MKKLITLLLFPVFAQAQTINVGGGLHNLNPMFQIEAGYQNNIVLMGSYEAIPTREAKAVNLYYGFKAGYEVKGFTPQIGYFFSKQCYSGLAYFLKYCVEINDNGGVYLEAGYLEHCQIAVGFKMNISL